MESLRSFEDLECYRLARELRMAISRMCKALPPEEERRLKGQILRSSRSVAANIAEGFGRHSHQENLQFCRQARGSLAETLEHLNCAFDEGFVGEDEYRALRQKTLEAWKVLNGYIAYLQRCRQSGVPTRKPDNPTT